LLRAVLDANVDVSAYVRPEGPPGRIVERLLRDGAFDVVLSAAIVEEVLHALAYPKVLKVARTKGDLDLWFEDIVVLAAFVTDHEIGAVSEDPGDDKYIAAAIEGRASFVVSGDPDLLDLRDHAGVRIVSPHAFLDLL
jgi:putative PIN family toxin of toxin-antitoxin system